jgi:tRNA A-37 threonylcarbamoyl transferase component Bud32
VENETLNLMTPPPQERLDAWLAEMYGKQVKIRARKLLRHRDLSYVERLYIDEAMPPTLIYKVVLPPWDVEQDLHEHILIPSVSNSARLYLSGTYNGTTAMLMEDLGEVTFLDSLAEHQELPQRVGTELAKLHRAFTYRIAEVKETGVLRSLLPADFETLSAEIAGELYNWNLVSDEQRTMLLELGKRLADKFADEPVSLVHGDLYAENLLFDGDHLFIIDWSWFTKISTPILDLATLSMEHFKNGALADRRAELIEAYCAEYSRNLQDTYSKLPWAELLGRLLFLEWLVERRRRGIMGTTVGPVEILIGTVLAELQMRLQACAG